MHCNTIIKEFNLRRLLAVKYRAYVQYVVIKSRFISASEVTTL